MNNMRAKLLQFLAAAVCIMMVALPVTAARINGLSCYPSGSYWYCARYDNMPFNSSCANVVPAPHLNLEVYQKTGGSRSSSALVNWHIGWKRNYQGCKYLLVAYEAKTGRCEKICYGSNGGQAGDILPRIGFPSGMKYDYDVSKELQKLYIGNGASPYLQAIGTGAGIITIAALTWAAVALIATAILLSVGK